MFMSAFICTVHKSAKRQSSHQCIFVLLGSSQVKAACKMLVKSTPSVKAARKMLVEINYRGIVLTKLKAVAATLDHRVIGSNPDQLVTWQWKHNFQSCT